MTNTPTNIPPIQFPQDEGVHPTSKTEWWYFNGHLQDDQGRDLDFFVALTAIPNVLEAKFNPDHWHPPVNLPNVMGAHGWEGGLTVRSPTNDPRHIPIRELRPYLLPWSTWDTEGLAKGRLDSTFSTFGMETARIVRTSETTISLEAPYGNGTRLSLQCTPKKPRPMLEGGQGAVHMGPLGWSRYYTFPLLEVQGTLSLDNSVSNVRGSAWMDHQWGDMAFVDGYKRWRWFGIQLEGGTEIVTFVFVDDQGVVQTQACMSLPDGTQKDLVAMRDQGQQPILIVTDQGEPWTSPTTGIRYPLTPILKIPAWEMELRVTPVMFDQEMVGKGPPDILTHGRFFPNYWEGGVTVEGTLNGAPVRGKAFQELLGFDDPLASEGVSANVRKLSPEDVAVELTRMLFNARRDKFGKPVL